ncbi:MAG: SPOR domain-containing protein [Candidatus Eisenbacteria sp.]|nr:SPOR domain-containing protein [Candidatus Eisenbacteria bacterium]
MKGLPAGADDRVDIMDPLPGTTLGERLREAAGVEGGLPASLVVLVTGKVRRADLARVALALASCWVGESRRVVVVDLFLGDGVFLDPLAGERDEGLGDYLLFGSSFGVIERKTAIPGLTLICAGAGSAETMSGLHGERMETFISVLRERFDVAFLIGEFPVSEQESPALPQWVDGRVEVVQAGEGTGGGFAPSFGWVEVTPALPTPERLAEEEKEQVAAPPAREVPRVGGERRWKAPRTVYLVLAFVVVAVVMVWQFKPWVSRQPAETMQEGMTQFPKLQVRVRPPEAVSPTPGRIAGAVTDAARVEEEASAHEPEKEPAPVPGIAEETASRTAIHGGLEGEFAVHVSSYRSRDRAEAEVRSLGARGFETEVVTVDLGSRGVWHRVWVGSLSSRAGAEDLARQLNEEEGFGYTRIVRRKR